MEKFSLNIGKDKITFGINNIKFLLGSNYIKKDLIVNNIKKHFYKNEDSDYAIENEFKSSFKINDKQINHRQYELIEVNNQFDLNEEQKLKTKSIFTKLLESTFLNIEYNEIVNTISILNDDLANHMNEQLKNFTTKYDIDIEFEDLVIKNIIKRVELNFLKDESKINQYDLNYNDKIINQIEIITKIAELNLSKKYLLIVEIPKVTKEIYNSLLVVKQENVKILVCSNDEKIYENNIDIKNILSVEKQVIDLSDDVSVYNNIVMNMGIHSTMKETELMLMDYFTKNGQDVNKIGEIL